MDSSDDELMSGYRDGRTAAFDLLFERHHGAVYHFACSMLHDAAAAEEVLQETFLAVAGGARSYLPTGHFRTWLMRIARNHCLNRISALQVRQRVVSSCGLDGIDAPSLRLSPPHRVEADEQLILLQRAIDGLPPRQREAMLLYALEEMTYQEIGQVLASPINTVKTLIHRGRANLAAALDEMETESGETP